MAGTMHQSPLFQRLVCRLAGFASDGRGAAAVEFAALLPFMLLLYIGGVEVSQGVSADRKVTLTSRTVADLASRSQSVDNPGMTGILNAASTVIAPYDHTKLTVTVSQVKIDAQGNATISWSDAYNGTARSKGQSVTVPSALATPNTYLIWGEASYAYRPTLGYVMTSTLNLKDAIFMAPRMSQCVARGATVQAATC
jgi:Flp pilus assembly protein TadG